jgi:putative oxidoreductase
MRGGSRRDHKRSIPLIIERRAEHVHTMIQVRVMRARAGGGSACENFAQELRTGDFSAGYTSGPIALQTVTNYKEINSGGGWAGRNHFRFEGCAMKTAFLVGRIVFGGYFIYNGVHHLTEKKAMASYTATKGVPAPELAVTATAVPLIAGGTSLLLGVKPKIGAIAILGFLAGVSPIMHDFWRNEDPAERSNNMISFMKNLALAGAALALMGVDEPWEASVPASRSRFSDKIRKIGRALAA